MHHNEPAIIVRGRVVLVAAPKGEEWLPGDAIEPVRMIEELARAHSRADILTFAQKPPVTAPRYAFQFERESIAVAQVADFNTWWEGLPQESRKNVRRSHKRGVVVSVREFNDDLVNGIVGVNNDCPVRQGRPHAHYGKSFAQVKQDFSSYLDRSDFICAHLGTELVGFIKLVDRGDSAAILNLLTKPSHNDARPANALIAKAVELCAARHIAWLAYGKFSYNKRESPLQEFKARNGFQEMLLPRYYVPLTRWGAICMKLNAHRGVRTMLPGKLLALAADARMKWYRIRAVHRPV
jgi:hypothetical protein